jgi:uncharacterized protein
VLRLSLVLLGAAAITWADPPQPVVPYATPDQFRPLPFDNQRLAGLLANRIRANHEGFLENINVPSLLKPFQAHRGANSGSVVEGEFAGRFLQAAASAYEYRHDSRLKELMDKVAVQLISLQKKNGYFSAYSDGERWTSGDLLVHRWTLRGLLSYWQATGEDDAYTSAQLIGDLLVNTFGAKADKQQLSGKEDGKGLPFRLAALQEIEPLIFLYRYTAEPSYLDLCKSIVRAVDINSTLLTPAPEQHLSDTLLSLAGLTELYRITGDKSYLSPVLRGWKALAGNGLLLTGSPLPSENGATVEWMKLTLNLLRITGESQYGQQLERTIYNQLLSAQDVQTGAIASEAPLSGKKDFSSKLTASTGRSLLSEAEGLALIPQAIWGRYGDGVLINLYTGGRATVQLRRRGLIQIYSEAAFPEKGEILLHVEPSHNIQFALALRVPEWTSSFTVDIDRQHLVGKHGELVTLHREWKRGDMVRISMMMDVSVFNGLDEASGRVAVSRGPQTLALSGKLNPHIGNLSLVRVPAEASSRLKLSPVDTPLPDTWSGDQVYKTEGEYDGKKQFIILVPFADAITYQVWLKKPNDPRGAEE